MLELGTPLTDLNNSLHEWSVEHPKTTIALESAGAAVFVLGSIAVGVRGAKLMNEVNDIRLHLAMVESSSVVTAESLSIAPVKIMTSDATRTLIRTDGYEKKANSHIAMEEIIAKARDGVLSGQITSDLVLEKFIAKNYLPEFHPSFSWSAAWEPHGQSGYPMRVHPTVGVVGTAEYVPLPNHLPYRHRISQLVQKKNKFSHKASESIDGAAVDFMKTKYQTWNAPKDWGWYPTTSSKTVTIANRRSEQLFQEIVRATTERSPDALAQTLERVAEMHWLNSQTWKFNRGSAGIADLKARTLLEVKGIDSGRYKIGVDPNLHALTSRNLSSFLSDYKDLFEEPPKYFAN